MFSFSLCARAGHAPSPTDQEVPGILGSLKVSSTGSSSILFARKISGGVFATIGKLSKLTEGAEGKRHIGELLLRT